jgi:hypothetical protein
MASFDFLISIVNLADLTGLSHLALQKFFSFPRMLNHPCGLLSQLKRICFRLASLNGRLFFQSTFRRTQIAVCGFRLHPGKHLHNLGIRFLECGLAFGRISNARVQVFSRILIAKVVFCSALERRTGWWHLIDRLLFRAR